MKKIIAFVAAVFFLCAAGGMGEGVAWAANARRTTRKQYRKNLAYNKNALPAGWRYEAGYTLWRMEKGLSANRHSYKRYKSDKTWRSRMNRYQRPEAVVLDTLDWTVEEIALFWQNYEHLFEIPPAGTTEEFR